MSPAAELPAHATPQPRAVTSRWSLFIATLSAILAASLIALGVPRIFTLVESARHVRAIAQNADALLAAMLNAETGQRGYILTGNEDYLLPYRDAAAGIEASTAALVAAQAEFRQDSPVAPLLAALLESSAGKQNELRETLLAFNQNGQDAAIARVRTGRGRYHMDRMRAQVAEIRRLTEEAANGSGGQAERLLSWGGFAVGGLLVLAYAAGLQGQRQGRAREREIAARIRAIYDAAPLGIAMLDCGLRFFTVNETLARLSGHAAEEHAGRSVAEMLPPPVATALAALLRHAVAAPGRVLDTTIEVPEGRGARRSWLCLARADAAPGGPSSLILILQDITARQAAEAERQLLTQELSHRVKNVMATVQALANQSWAGAAGDGDAFMAVFSERLRSLARAQGLLTESAWSHAGLNMVLEAGLAPWLSGRHLRIEAPPDGPMPQLGSSQILGLALVLHELATNAAKYGALSVPDGRVTLSWRREEDGRVLMVWREAGGPEIPGEPTREGFGSFLVSRAFAADSVPGEVSRDFAPTGLVVAFRFTPES